MRLLEVKFWIKYFGLIERKKAKKIADKRYEKGFSNGVSSQNLTHTTIIEKRAYDSKKASQYIVPSTTLGITDSLKDKIRSQLPVKHKPTGDQERLILSNARNIRVVAGAGSGKSTTLVQRLLVLHRDLGIPLDEITVFSFTNASCNDFRSKVIKEFSKNGIKISKDQSKQLVRTFHSKVMQFNSALVKSRKPFEFYGDKNKIVSDDLGSLATTLNNDQLVLFKEHYRDCFERSKTFRDDIAKLLLAVTKNKIVSQRDNDNAKRFVENIEIKDKEFTTLVHDCFDLKHGKLEKPSAITARDHEGKKRTFYINGYIKSLKLYVAFTPEYNVLNEVGLGADTEIGEGKSVTKLHLTSTNKFSYFNACLNANLICLRKRVDADLLNLAVAVNDYQYKHDPDIVRVKLEGEISESNILDSFFQVGTFIESVGLDVADMADCIDNPRNGLSDQDYLFARLLIQFWKDLDLFLESRDLVRFHKLFQNFSHEDNSHFRDIDDSCLKSMSNIMIDEFQDISAEAVAWIKATLFALRRRQVETSIVCVGDDYQSIYGWRGAAPSYLINYRKYFCSKDLEDIRMNENFRSYQSIVDAGEHALVTVKSKIEKHGICLSDSNGCCNIEIIGDKEIYENDKNSLIEKAVDRVVELIQQYQNSEGRASGHGNGYLLVLAKTNRVLNKVARALKEKVDAKLIAECTTFQTYHRSKGLEAEYCVLVEDCFYDSRNPLKNLIYERSRKFDETFDRAQKEESKRLAYVAMTRAMKAFYWFGVDKNGGSIKDIKKFLKN